MKKKLMLLGGNYFQMTLTKAARDLGCHVISVDYLPDNPAHKYADEYYNVSTTDREAVLALARRLGIDGIVSYASDVSAPTAAYVAEALGLPTNPLSAVELLTRKDKTRAFMDSRGFLTPRGAGFARYDEARDFLSGLKTPVMVKPVDASGSKGVTKLTDPALFRAAWDEALAYSRCGTVIVEEFIERDGYQIAGDAFLSGGELVFAGLMNEHFDRLCNGLVPVGESYPSILPEPLKRKALGEIQRLLSEAGMRQGAVNLDFLVDKAGDVYILELGPRNGGNLITDALRAACGVDLAAWTIRAALGETIGPAPAPGRDELVSSYIVHSLADGTFRDVAVSDDIRGDLLRFDVFARPGEAVRRFDNGSFGLGAALIRHDSVEQMLYRMDHMEEFIRVQLEEA